MYQRKTRDIFIIEQYTGPTYGWEDVCCEDTLNEAKKRRDEYRENQPGYPVRIRKKRERIQNG